MLARLQRSSKKVSQKLYPSHIHTKAECISPENVTKKQASSWSLALCRHKSLTMKAFLELKLTTWSTLVLYAFRSFSINTARLAASSRLTQPSPSGRPSANAYKVADTERAIRGSAACSELQLHSTSSTLSSSKRWTWIVIGLSFGPASRKPVVNESTLISPCWKLIVQVRCDVPGKGWPRRKKKESVASSAVYGDGWS